MLPIRPMIGFVAVTPKEETVTIVPGDHGGNMDNREVTANNRLYLPVFVDGGLIYMGDLHATMGDGEICAMGIECAGEVTAKISLLKNKNILRPRVETAKSVMTIGSAVKLDDAIKIAVDDMVNLVSEMRDLTVEEAYTLTSLVADLEICQVVNGLLTVRMKMPKSVLPKAIA
jgi:amidase